jgi:hypothetical protein
MGSATAHSITLTNWRAAIVDCACNEALRRTNHKPNRVRVAGGGAIDPDTNREDHCNRRDYRREFG